MKTNYFSNFPKLVIEKTKAISDNDINENGQDLISSPFINKVSFSEVDEKKVNLQQKLYRSLLETIAKNREFDEIEDEI
jgi:hypothetical protein